jgi:hypothetical protein
MALFSIFTFFFQLKVSWLDYVVHNLFVAPQLPSMLQGCSCLRASKLNPSVFRIFLHSYPGLLDSFSLDVLVTSGTDWSPRTISQEIMLAHYLPVVQKVRVLVTSGTDWSPRTISQEIMLAHYLPVVQKVRVVIWRKCRTTKQETLVLIT